MVSKRLATFILEISVEAKWKKFKSDTDGGVADVGYEKGVYLAGLLAGGRQSCRGGLLTTKD